MKHNSKQIVRLVALAAFVFMTITALAITHNTLAPRGAYFQH